MASDPGKDEQHARGLIEQLPPHQFSVVVGPIEEESETEDERKDVERSREWLRQRGAKAFLTRKCSGISV
ncbi:MAG: hypothetical protein LC126_07395 [Bryobacterales bacterium]|nr:hypothetical protein [Bryobacterales bacterium]